MSDSGENSLAANKLYVGNLTPDTSEEQIKAMVAPFGPVSSVKLIRNANSTFSFVTMETGASEALLGLQEFILNGNRVRVNWAFGTQQQRYAHGPKTGAPLNISTGNQSNPLHNQIELQSSSPRPNPTQDNSLHHVFVGDLSPLLTDAMLFQAFASKYPSMAESRVMWDAISGKSRGYGFIAFRELQEAEAAIKEMNGAVIANRSVRLNWANQKNASPRSDVDVTGNFGPPLQFEHVLVQTSAYNTTVYIGNLSPTITDLLFSQFGYIMDRKAQFDRGFAFVKFDTHENAANAICHIHGTVFKGRQVRCFWGKDKTISDPYLAPSSPIHYYHHPFSPVPTPLGTPLSAGLNQEEAAYYHEVLPDGSTSPGIYGTYNSYQQHAAYVNAGWNTKGEN